NPASGTTAAPFSVSVNPTGMTPGTYTGSITVAGTSAGSGSQQIPVTFTVTNDPLLNLHHASLSFPYQIEQSVPGRQLLRASSSTGATVNYTATIAQTTCTGSNWLLVNGGTAAVTGSTDSGTLVVSVNPSGLAAGTCTGNITFAATVAS